MAARGTAILLLAAVLTAVAFPLPAAPPSSDKLREVEAAIAKERAHAKSLETQAAAIDAEMAKLRDDLVAAARATQDHEAEVTRLEARLEVLSAEEAEKTERLEANHGSFARVLMALARLARHPPEALIAQPLSPSDTVRSALLLRASVPRIEARAQRLKGDIEDLLAARREIARRKTELASAALRLDRERTRLDTLLGRKGELRERTRAEIQTASLRVQKLAGEARSLRGLLDRLEKERRQRAEKKAREEAARKAKEKEAPKAAASPALPVTAAKGSLVFPVVGRVYGRYGQSSAPGMARKGITIRTRSGAQVVAPYGGNVVYADHFRGYGRLLIIEHGEGYHTLLAGLGRIDGVIGQTVVAGEPVGVMGRPDDGKPTLYVELRRHGQPINPLPWLAVRKSKDEG